MDDEATHSELPERSYGDEPVAPVELLGVRIKQFGPINCCFVPLDGPFTVLYGLNGAGKTHVLNALAEGFAVAPQLDLASSNITSSSSGMAEVSVYMTSAAWTIARTIERDPWNPWQAMWAGARQYIKDEHKGLEEQPGDIVEAQVALMIAQKHVTPWLNERLGLDLAPPASVGQLTEFVWMLSDLLVAAWPEEFVQSDSRETFGFKEGADVFWPIGDAFLERRLIVTTTERDRSISLGRAQEGKATTTWCEELRTFLRSQIATPYTMEEMLVGIAELNAEQLKEFADALEAITAERNAVHANTAAVDTNIVKEEDADELMDLEQARRRYAEDGSDAFTDELLDGYGSLGHCLKWDSVFAEVLRVDSPPMWAADVILSGGDDPGPLPFVLLNESGDWGGFETVQSLLGQRVKDDRVSVLAGLFAQIGVPWESRRRGSRVSDFDLSLLLQESEGTLQINPDLPLIAVKLADVANRILKALIPGAPQITCHVAPVYSWSASHPIDWRAIDASGVEIAKEGLSAAEFRWAQFSLRLADALENRTNNKPIMVLIDEPERALHRRAERQLASGLAQLGETYNVHLVVASHSPAFLAHRSASLQHVRRAPDGTTVVEPVPGEFFERAAELGLDSTDLLQLCRAMLLVEGQHELVILDELIGDELRELGVEMLCMRGATTLKAWDAQLIQRYTDVPFVVLVDNDRADRLSTVWQRAKEAAGNGSEYLGIIDELKSGAAGSEGAFLRELCKNLISGSQTDRYHITAFEAADVPEYLPPAGIAPNVGDKTWQQLKSEAQNKAKSSSSFKNWMKEVYGADYSDRTLRAAAQTMDSVPQEFSELLDLLRRIVRAV
jgi:hypothetical protein